MRLKQTKNYWRNSLRFLKNYRFVKFTFLINVKEPSCHGTFHHYARNLSLNFKMPMFSTENYIQATKTEKLTKKEVSLLLMLRLTFLEIKKWLINMIRPNLLKNQKKKKIWHFCLFSTYKKSLIHKKSLKNLKIVIYACIQFLKKILKLKLLK